MKNWKEIEIPQKMRHLPKDKRGFPIPFTIIKDTHGIPNFSQHNPVCLTQSIKNKLCSICGQSLGADIWLIAGAKIALNPRGGYIDPPIHKQCGSYALQVCPYLANPSFLKVSADEVTTGKHVQMYSGKPVVFGFVKTTDYEVILHPNGTKIILPVRPFLDIEFWRNGQRIPPNQAKMLVRE